MEKDILVSISGLQYDMGVDETIEMITNGQYYRKNGKQYIVYDEIFDNENIRNIIKISDNKVEVVKRGASYAHMLFEENKSNQTYYNTSYGSILIGLITSKIHMEQGEKEINLSIEYGLDLNGSHLSDCILKINAKQK